MKGLLKQSRYKRLWLFWLLAIIGIASPWLLAIDFTDQLQCRVNSVHDGDTLRATCDGERTKVRLYCIDTAEMKQRPWGRESRDFLRSITPAQVTLIQYDKDKYGRIVGEIWDGDNNLNLQMVSSGNAAVYPKYCRKSEYYAAESKAKDAQLGIWSKPGLHQTPWQWRHRK